MASAWRSIAHARKMRTLGICQSLVISRGTVSIPAACAADASRDARRVAIVTSCPRRVSAAASRSVKCSAPPITFSIEFTKRSRIAPECTIGRGLRRRSRKRAWRAPVDSGIVRAVAGTDLPRAASLTRRLVVLFAASFALRVAAVLVIGEFKHPNVWESGAIAEALLAGHGFAFDWRAMLGTPPEANVASTWWPPAYPAFLAACHVIAPRAPYLAASLAQALLSALLPLLLFAMARHLFGERAGWIAALAAAVHPPFLGFAALIQTALFEIFWTTLALYFALRAGDAGDGDEASDPPASDASDPLASARPRAQSDLGGGGA